MKRKRKIFNNENNSEEESGLHFNKNSRLISISGTINRQLADELFNILTGFESLQSRKPVTIHINSEGGEIYATIKIYDHIRHSRCPIIIIGSGIVFSGAIIVFLAGDLRLAFPNASFGFHWPIRHVEGSENPDEIQEAADCQNNFFKRAMHIAKDRTKISNQKILRKLFRTAKVFDVETAIEYGVVHQVISPPKKILPKSWHKILKEPK